MDKIYLEVFHPEDDVKIFLGRVSKEVSIS